jgi:phage-related protein
MLEFKEKTNMDMGITVTNLGRRKRAEEQIDNYEIPYRNDELVIHSNKYKPYIRNIEFALPNKSVRSLVNQWLTGRGKLRTSDDVDGFFEASVFTAIEPEKMMNNVDGFTVGFKVNPFFYLDCGEKEVEVNSSMKIHNPGTIYAQPYIKITGSGNIDLMINTKIYSFLGVDGYIEIDSELMVVYKDTINQGEKMIGEFPLLTLGENAITWTGAVTNVKIIPRWREL